MLCCAEVWLPLHGWGVKAQLQQSLQEFVGLCCTSVMFLETWLKCARKSWSCPTSSENMRTLSWWCCSRTLGAGVRSWGAWGQGLIAWSKVKWQWDPGTDVLRLRSWVLAYCKVPGICWGSANCNCVSAAFGVRQAELERARLFWGQNAPVLRDVCFLVWQFQKHSPLKGWVAPVHAAGTAKCSLTWRNEFFCHWKFLHRLIFLSLICKFCFSFGWLLTISDGFGKGITSHPALNISQEQARVHCKWKLCIPVRNHPVGPSPRCSWSPSLSPQLGAFLRGGVHGAVSVPAELQMHPLCWGCPCLAPTAQCCLLSTSTGGGGMKKQSSLMEVNI